MTHSTNYGNDRLALYTFESVIRFLQCWTNFELKSVGPLEMGSRYFSDFPEEKLPVWGVSQSLVLIFDAIRSELCRKSNRPT